ncbi:MULTISPECIES: DUF262 domain-containing protein [Bacillus]|uniref:DUF262 domain-containing protein n=1 Tax=Bacillus TaxID=1386 RepID=UPI0015CEFB28|nr:MULTISPECIES: DUF262 domain-containing protein [Bacillus]
MIKENLDIEADAEVYKIELQGIEYEEYDEDENNEECEVPFDAEKIRIEQRMLSLKYIKELLENKQLELSPGFQRNKVWKEAKRKSLLIESLMLRIPIPAFYFYEDENSSYYVIDGLQRLSTIEDFINNEFKLSGLQYLQDVCGGKKFIELEQKYVNRIYQTQFAVNIIDSRTPPKVKYDIFRRINTGGVSLNAQEIRNSIARPKIRKFLKEITKDNIFVEATGNINDQRMAAQELVLRFIAFLDAYDFENKYIHYEKGDLEHFLDNAFESLNKCSDEELNFYKNKILTAMENSYALFGKYAFRNCLFEDFIKDNKKRLLNKSLFVTWAVLLSDENLETNRLKKLRLRASKLLSEEIEFDEEYFKALTMGTNATKRVKKSFAVARNILEEVLANDK